MGPAAPVNGTPESSNVIVRCQVSRLASGVSRRRYRLPSGSPVTLCAVCVDAPARGLGPYTHVRHGLPQERTFAGAPRAVVTVTGTPWVRWNRLVETRPMVLVARNPDRIDTSQVVGLCQPQGHSL